MESESESDSAPLPPQQIPTIVIYESPPQNADMDQEWNNSSKTNDNVPQVAVLDNTIVLSSDTSALNSSEETNEVVLIEDLAPNLEAVAEAELPLESVEGKFNQPGDLEVGLDSPSSKKEVSVSFVDEALETKLSSPDHQIESSQIICDAPSTRENVEPEHSLPGAGSESLQKITGPSATVENREAKMFSPDRELGTPLKFTAPLATGESSSDLSISSDIDSLAKEIVSDVLKAAQDTIVEHQPPKSISHEDVQKQSSVVSQTAKEPDEKITPVSSEPNEISCITLDTDIDKISAIDVVTPEITTTKNFSEQTTKCLDSSLPKLSNTEHVTIIKDDEIKRNFPSEMSAKEVSLESISAPFSAVAESFAKHIKVLNTDDSSVKNKFDKFDTFNNKMDANDTILLDDSSNVSMCDAYLDDSFENTKDTPSFITIRKKKNSTRNESFEWDSDNGPSLPVSCFEEEDSVIPIDSFVAKDISQSNIAPQSHIEGNIKLSQHVKNASPPKSIEICNSPYSFDVSKQEQNDSILCLSQSLPNSSSSFLQGSPFPKTVSYTSEFTNAKSERIGSKPSDATNYINRLLPPLESKAESADTLSKDSSDSKYPYEVIDLMSRSDTLVSRSPSIADRSSELSTSSKEDSKYKGYSGSFAEKMRPKSLFCDAIYLRSLDIKLQTQPFPSLNKSDDALDEYCKSEEEDNVRRKLFDENNKSVEDLDSSDFVPSSGGLKGPVCSTPFTSTCLKQKDSLEKHDKASNLHLNKQKSSNHKHSSVSFSAPESYSDLVSPYTCGQVRTSEDKGFPTKVKPKCDMDIARLKQKREKRKSVHEDIQGLPFADEEKMMSPVDPVASSEVFEAARDQSCVDNPCLISVTKTPDLIDEERFLRMQSTVEQEKARQEARARARLKSDEELGLSPNNYRKKYRRQLSLNSINYDELCSDEFCDQDDELEDDVMNSFCQNKILGIEETFSMFKNSDLCSKSKIPVSPLASSQQQPTQSSETCVLPLATNESFDSTDTLHEVECTPENKSPQPQAPKHSSSPETSPDICVLEQPSFDSKKTKSKGSLTEVSGDDSKTKPNGKKSIFSILNFSKGHQSKEKVKQKTKGSEKDLSSSLPSDFGAHTNAKAKPFSHLKLSKSKEKCNKIKSKSVPPESVPLVESTVHQEEPTNFLMNSQHAKTKYTVYRNPETSISTFPVHLPLPKMENGLAPKASGKSLWLPFRLFC